MYYTDIEKITLENLYYRKVLHTTNTQQLVVMCITPQDKQIDTETHPKTTQLIRIESGRGLAILKHNGNKELIQLKQNSLLIIDPGVEHTIINTHNVQSLKLYSVYSPPEHPENARKLRKSGLKIKKFKNFK